MSKWYQSIISLGLIASLVCIPTTLLAEVNNELVITKAWVKEAPPGVKVLAGYLNISNLSHSEIHIAEIKSPDFKSVEIHHSVIEDGIAKMVKQNTLAIKAGETIKLEPGGLHLMLIKPDTRKKQGDEVTLDLYLSGESIMTIKAPVQQATGHTNHHNQH